TQSTLFYTPDLSRPGYSRSYDRSNNIKVTWKAGNKHKFTFGEINQRNCGCFYFMGPNRAPEAGQSYYFVPIHLIQSTWTFPASNRLLFEAGSSLRIDGQTIERPPEVSPSDIAAFDQRLDMWYGSNFTGPNVFGSTVGWIQTGYGYHGDMGDSAQRFKMSYITGSHAFKTGVEVTEQRYNEFSAAPLYSLPVAYQFNNRVPTGLWEMAAPNFSKQKHVDLSIFAQDQ